MYSHEHLDPYALATHSSAFMSLVSFFFLFFFKKKVKDMEEESYLNLEEFSS